MSERHSEKGFSLMELLVAIGIMAAIAAVTIPLVTKFVDRGQSGAQSKELEHIQTSMRSLMADAALITVDANSTTARLRQ
ncbi:MAG: prepilin-type N-terminal cleavage/methylation domain-containing protein [Chloroflexi bacterium]|nr:prepilin-type N-terminal cleavage/methylation domain-containing protein [Chloroflexota bacterium]